ncbi:MAG: tRNA (adenosine(37)-N6)-dimethylallyltransferase MiaA [Phycisphaerae bacterium]
MPATLNLIIGCTGSGKAGLGRELARRTGGHIISIDSMKVYRRMDIGTAKPAPSVLAEIPHHMIDVAEPSEEFSVARYVSDTQGIIESLAEQGVPIFVVGGTALYVKALTEGLFDGPSADDAIRAELHAIAEREGSPSLHRELASVDPAAGARIHPNDLRRIIRALEVFRLTGTPITDLQEQWDRERTQYDCVFLGIRRELEDQNQRTNQRVRTMIDHGLVDEVRGLIAESEPLSETACKAVGYAEIIRHLNGEISLAEATELIKINTRHLAKSQRTWFKRIRDAHWLDVTPDDTAQSVADVVLQERLLSWSP